MKITLDLNHVKLRMDRAVEKTKQDVDNKKIQCSYRMMIAVIHNLIDELESMIEEGEQG